MAGRRLTREHAANKRGEETPTTLLSAARRYSAAKRWADRLREQEVRVLEVLKGSTYLKTEARRFERRRRWAAERLRGAGLIYLGALGVAAAWGLAPDDPIPTEAILREYAARVGEAAPLLWTRPTDGGTSSN